MSEEKEIKILNELKEGLKKIEGLESKEDFLYKYTNFPYNYFKKLMSNPMLYNDNLYPFNIISELINNLSINELRLLNSNGAIDLMATGLGHHETNFIFEHQTNEEKLTGSIDIFEDVYGSTYKFYAKYQDLNEERVFTIKNTCTANNEISENNSDQNSEKEKAAEMFIDLINKSFNIVPVERIR